MKTIRNAGLVLKRNTKRYVTLVIETVTEQVSIYSFFFLSTQTNIGFRFLDQTAVHKMSYRAKETVWIFMRKHCHELSSMKRAGQFKSCRTIRNRMDRDLPQVWMDYMAVDPETKEKTYVDRVPSMNLKANNLEQSWIQLEIGYIDVSLLT